MWWITLLVTVMVDINNNSMDMGMELLGMDMDTRLLVQRLVWGIMKILNLNSNSSSRLVVDMSRERLLLMITNILLHTLTIMMEKR
jgi:hypothetical protein